MSRANTVTVTGIGTVYECPEYETRYLDEQRCPDCALFARRIGTGGTCPHCEEPVAITDLTPGDPMS